ncbi:hypothetical protein TRVL_06364 [Trypanosoma vivax]|uniref:Uncharacterized protein n=1 Tax=Trypanosoma vivax (strain Y486) TaxID=1055687 RepID=G0U5B2_TRYVY|nr:hypothetical protein TRVL_06364 [Trypanosoma vivax]CCC51060.1 hypothetical protein, unlikely [Trypanosoma vivax Y486]
MQFECSFENKDSSMPTTPPPCFVDPNRASTQHFTPRCANLMAQGILLPSAHEEGFWPFLLHPCCPGKHHGKWRRGVETQSACLFPPYFLKVSYLCPRSSTMPILLRTKLSHRKLSRIGFDMRLFDRSFLGAAIGEAVTVFLKIQRARKHTHHPSQPLPRIKGKDESQTARFAIKKPPRPKAPVSIILFCARQLFPAIPTT